jgi:hypothetical protein
MPQAVVRIYANSSALLAVAREQQARITDVVRDLPGLQVYSVSGDAASATAVSITVCADKAGTDESIKRGAAIVKELLPDANIAPPRVLSGEIVIRLAAEDVASRTGDPHLMLRMYHQAFPEGVAEHEADLKQDMSAIPEWRVFSGFVDEATGHGVVVMAADDAAGLEKMTDALKAWGQAALHVTPEPPEVITTSRIFRFDAASETYTRLSI